MDADGGAEVARGPPLAVPSPGLRCQVERPNTPERYDTALCIACVSPCSERFFITGVNFRRMIPTPWLDPLERLARRRVGPANPPPVLLVYAYPCVDGGVREILPPRSLLRLPTLELRPVLAPEYGERHRRACNVAAVGVHLNAFSRNLPQTPGSSSLPIYIFSLIAAHIPY
ncbi:hypothetical protein VTN77DRAFT_2368 [Rasamsonia byssochlamydoides]|uniref:uncharacterized protein n=1 Tax=Rasamsonia byssochlamydoides TaxID=89139 RepID=UPI003742A422